MAALMVTALCALLSSALAEVYFEETFCEPDWKHRWTHTTVQRGHTGHYEKFKWSSGKWSADRQISKGIMTTRDHRHYAISAKLDKPMNNTGKQLVIQYTAKFEEDAQHAFCGGGYIKLFGKNHDAKKLTGDSPYNIMFGPDFCAYQSRIMLVFEHKGKYLVKKKEVQLKYYKEKNRFTHLYTLVLNADNSWGIYFDGELKGEGFLPGNSTDGWEFDADARKTAKEGGQIAQYDSHYLGFEIWAANGGSLFDNILISDSHYEARSHAYNTHAYLKEKEEDAKKKFDEKQKRKKGPRDEL